MINDFPIHQMKKAPANSFKYPISPITNLHLGNLQTEYQFNPHLSLLSEFLH